VNRIPTLRRGFVLHSPNTDPYDDRAPFGEGWREEEGGLCCGMDQNRTIPAEPYASLSILQSAASTPVPDFELTVLCTSKVSHDPSRFAIVTIIRALLVGT